MAMFTQCVLACAAFASLLATGADLPGPPASSQPSAGAVVLPDRLRVVTFNTENCSGGVDRFIDFLRKKNADVVFLQEVPRAVRGQPDVAARLANGLGDFHVLSATTLNVPVTQACDQAILSRLPLSGGRIHTLAEGGWVYAIEAAIDGSGGPLHLFSVHTHSTFRLEAKHVIQSSTTRMEQVSGLLDIVRKLDGDVIVAGDFNATPWMPEYYAITRLLTDFGTVSQDPKLSFPAHKPSVRIDYFFGRGKLAARSYEVLDSRLSDHRPVVADLEWKTPASKPEK